MATVFENVHLSSFSENGDVIKEYEAPVRLEITTEQFAVHIKVLNDTKELQKIPVDDKVELASVGQQSLLITACEKSFFLKFTSPKDLTCFQHQVKENVSKKKQSVFNQRTDPASAEQYFQFYGYLSQQQNMMQDYIRTSTYQRAMLDNTIDFQDKVVLDVGAGSGILSFFAIQAGARKVYAIEASSMATHCKLLVQNNKLHEKIYVLAGKIEELDLPEQVDIIISEPMGYMLFNERMLETYLHAKKWLKPGGKMFPTQGDLHVTPFTDDALYMEQFSKANFWYQPSFHGVDLCSLREAAVKEYFKQPIVDTFDIRICMARSIKYTVDFRTAHETDLHDIEFPLSFLALTSGTVHGLAFWFDVAFIGSQRTVWLSTSPAQPLTHWYQVRCLLQNPVFVKQGQTLAGKVHLCSNARQSYDVDIELYVSGTSTKSCNTLDLKNPFFRYTGQQPQAPPGTNEASPSDAYWNQQDATVAVQHVQANTYGMNPLLNGGIGDGQAQTGVVHNNLVPLVQVASLAPVNPGSIPAATIVSANNAASQAIQTRTSVGGGLSPTVFGQISSSNTVYPISNQFMIGDYVIPGSMAAQGLASGTYKLGGV